MPQRVTITVIPSSDHPEYLTVQDAMLQIADAFTLLKGAGEGDSEWRLVSASTNSPLTAVGEQFSPSGDPASISPVGLEEAYQAISDVLAGNPPSPDLNEPVLQRLLKRNMNGVGLTRIELEGHDTIEVTPAFAKAGLHLMEVPELSYRPVPKRVRGTLEGELIDAGHYYRQPALKLRERLRKRIIWCKIPSHLEEEFAAETSLKDVWKNARVRLRGWIEYHPSGVISVMTADRIQHVLSGSVPLKDLHDPDFTGGMDSVAYIEHLRDGDVG